MRPWFALALLAGCAEKAAQDTSATDAEATWYRDVQPIVEKSCASCHDGHGVGGVNLTDPEIAVSMAAVIAGYVSAGIMPPPSADPGCRDYGGAERMNLTDEERAVIQTWYDEGAPLGDPGSAPAPVSWGTVMEDPDVVLTMPFEYTLNPDLDGNEYYCVELENPLTETVYVKGLDVLTGNASVVHHMILVKDEGGDAGEAWGVEDATQGFTCRDPMMEDDWTMLHAWAPGMDVTEMASNIGMKIEPGDQLVLQMHYFADDEDAGATDQSSYLLQVDTTAPQKEVQLVAFGPSGFRIPADEPAHQETEELYNSYVPIYVYGVFPHLHLLGTHYESWVENGDGSTDCLASGDWNFDHQAFYMYDEPYTLNVDSTLYGQCTWDNTADNPWQYNDPPSLVTYGEGTNQEMCFFLFYASF